MIAGGAFRDREFRRFFTGVFFAVQAIWVQRVTIGWLAWERTNSPAFVGTVAALSLFPTLLAGPVFGVMADRVDIRRAAFSTNGLMALVLALLAVALPIVGQGGLALAALAIGMISAAHHPVRMSLGPRLVSQPLVQHVVAITALNFNLARLIAPVVAGWIIATWGAGTALWVSVVCYMPMIAVLPFLHPRALPPRPRAPFLRDLAEGFRYAMEAPVIREALVLTLIFSTILRGALEILPVLADGGFGQGAAGLGILTAAAGGGAVVSATLKAAGVGASGGRVPLTLWAVAAFGQVTVMAMGLAPVWPVAIGVTTLAGFAATWCGVSLQAVIQSDLPDMYRGRVMSLYVVMGFGTVAVGAFIIGQLGEWFAIGPALVIAGAGGLALQAILFLGVRPRPKRPM